MTCKVMVLVGLAACSSSSVIVSSDAPIAMADGAIAMLDTTFDAPVDSRGPGALVLSGALGATIPIRALATLQDPRQPFVVISFFPEGPTDFELLEFNFSFTQIPVAGDYGSSDFHTATAIVATADQHVWRAKIDANGPLGTFGTLHLTSIPSLELPNIGYDIHGSMTATLPNDDLQRLGDVTMTAMF